MTYTKTLTWSSECQCWTAPSPRHSPTCADLGVTFEGHGRSTTETSRRLRLALRCRGQSRRMSCHGRSRAPDTLTPENWPTQHPLHTHTQLDVIIIIIIIIITTTTTTTVATTTSLAVFKRSLKTYLFTPSLHWLLTSHFCHCQRPHFRDSATFVQCPWSDSSLNDT